MTVLLIVMAFAEVAAGLLILIMPSVVVRIFLGAPLDTPTGIIVGRIAGAALVSIGLICWQARNLDRGGATSAIVAGMLFYNQAVAVLFVYASLKLGLESPLIWAVFVFHQSLAVWCFVNLWVTSRLSARA